MSRIKRTRPSPALVISIVAMFAALGGGAFAATATTSKQALDNKGNLKKNVVKKKNIANGAIVTKKLKDGKVTGSKLSDESVSASKLGSISTTSSQPETMVGITNTTATVTCPGDSKVTGGGYTTNGQLVAAPFVLPIGVESKRSNNGWTATAFDLAGAGTGTIVAHAYCLDENG